MFNFKKNKNIKMLDILANVTDYDAEYKIILVGDTTVGKTSLFKKITSGVFLDKNVQTIGRDRKTLELEITVKQEEKDVQKKINIYLEDTAGQEKYKAITKTYFKGANGALLLYNICDKKSFAHIKEWLAMVRENIGNYEDNKYLVFMMGTKLDIVEDDQSRREVSEEEAIDFCDKNDIIWAEECSSKKFTLEEFKEIFGKFAKELYEKVGYNKIERNTVSTLDKKKSHNKRHCAC